MLQQISGESFVLSKRRSYLTGLDLFLKKVIYS